MQVMFEFENHPEIQASDLAVAVKDGIATVFGLVNQSQENQRRKCVSLTGFGA